MIEIKEPKYDKKWFKYHAKVAIIQYEQKRNRDTKDQLLNVLAGLYELAYQKGRRDA